MTRPVVFFAHHQGRGHSQRILAIASEMNQIPIYVATAAPEHFDQKPDNMEVVELPDMIGAPCATPAMFEYPSPPVLHCTPVGVPEMRRAARTILDTLDDCEAGLFVVDVSAEMALLGRIASVPTVITRLHGERSDVGHQAALDCAVSVLAPFNPVIEQGEYPEQARAKTFYTGGLCTTSADIPDQQSAREKLGLPDIDKIVVVLSGSGGSGASIGALSIAARVEPDTQFIILGPASREGHETDFANMHELGWVDNVTDYLAAADIVIASAGDNTVHEIARVGRPYICIPEWRYFDEQKCKAEQLGAIGAVLHLSDWPGSPDGWAKALEDAEKLDLGILSELHDPMAAQRGAEYLTDLNNRLWTN